MWVQKSDMDRKVDSEEGGKEQEDKKEEEREGVYR